MTIWAKWVEGDQRFAFALSDNGGYAITRKRHSQLLEACSSAKVLRPGKGGEPQLIDRSAPSVEELQARERVWRSVELNRHEWLMTRHRDEQDMNRPGTLTPEQLAELLHYRQALRDWPPVADAPRQERRPQPPAWLAEISA